VFADLKDRDRIAEESRDGRGKECMWQVSDERHFLGTKQGKWAMRFSCCIVLLLSLGWCLEAVPAAERSMVSHDVVVNHPGFQPKGPKTVTLRQIRDQRGLPTGYSMVVESVVCVKEVCRVSRVRMFWDALGRYQRYELPQGEVLEKGVVVGKGKAATWKGAAFSDADHRKLDHILKDSYSLLKQQTLSGISGVGKTGEVDGVTGATPRAVRNSVVKGAPLTSFHLWHWAHGDIVKVATGLTHSSCNEELLRGFLGSDSPHYVLFALDHVKRHELFGPPVVADVIKVMHNGHHGQMKLGLAYLREAIPDKDRFHDNVATLFKGNKREGRTHLLDLLTSEKELPGTLFDKMSEVIAGADTYYELHLFLRLVEKHGHVSQPLLTRVSRLLESDNFFIARRAYWYLEKRTTDERTRKHIQTFRDKCKKDGRSLE